jgi:hypothetical protein
MKFMGKLYKSLFAIAICGVVYSGFISIMETYDLSKELSNSSEWVDADSNGYFSAFQVQRTNEFISFQGTLSNNRFQTKIFQEKETQVFPLLTFSKTDSTYQYHRFQRPPPA